MSIAVDCMNKSSHSIQSYKKALSTFPTGVCLIVMKSGEEYVGVTISSFASISLSPPIVQFSLKNQSRFLGEILNKTSYSIHILSEAQSEVATHFATNPASIVDPHTLENTASVIHCEVEEILPKGDHTLIFGEVQSIEARDQRSLVYYQSKFCCVTL